MNTFPRWRRGFTLVELMMAVALTGIVMGTIGMVLRAGLEAWTLGQVQIEMQETASLLMDQLMEGTDHFDGLREVLEVGGYENGVLMYIPWWEQKVPFIHPGEKITLEQPFHPAAGIPVAQVLDRSRGVYTLTDIAFYPAARSGAASQVEFLNPELKGQRGRIFFYPAPGGHADTEMRIVWDTLTGRLERHYRGKKRPLARTAPETRVTGFDVEFMDGTNSLIKRTALQDAETRSRLIHALRVILTVERGQESYTLRSFVNVRKKGIAGQGILVTEGASIAIPNSKKIKTLSLLNFFGVDKEGSFTVRIHSKTENKTYLLRASLTLRNGIPWIEQVSIEYPRGRTVFQTTQDQPASHGINLLTVDFSGRFDYDEDEGVEGQVVFGADDVQFSLERSDIQGFHLLVR